MTAVRIKINTEEYAGDGFRWYEVYGSQTNLALVDVVNDAEFSELGFANSFIHAEPAVTETWYYWVRAAYEAAGGAVTYGTLVALGSITLANAPGDVSGPGSSINNNLAAFNGTTGKVIKDSGLSLDTDTTLAANSDSKIPSQKAVKAYVLANAGGGGATGPTKVQQASVRTTSGTATSATATFGATPTVGNIIIAIQSGFSNGSILQGLTGFSNIFNQQGSPSNQGMRVDMRTVQPGDGTSWTCNFSGSNNGGQAMLLLEFSNLVGFVGSAGSGGPSGTTWNFGGSKPAAGAFTVEVLEADSTNGYSSISGPASLLFDGTGGGTNHPSVFAQVTGLGTVTVTYTGSAYSNPMQGKFDFL